MAGCRDCARCTETPLVGLVMAPFRVVWWVCTFWNIQLVTKRCPQCKHRMSVHARRADGSFRD